MVEDMKVLMPVKAALPGYTHALIVHDTPSGWYAEFVSLAHVDIEHLAKAGYVVFGEENPPASGVKHV